jgi:hypothetical protein
MEAFWRVWKKVVEEEEMFVTKRFLTIYRLRPSLKPRKVQRSNNLYVVYVIDRNFSHRVPMEFFFLLMRWVIDRGILVIS